MRTVTTYRCEVDVYRNGEVFRGRNQRLYHRNTQGIYLVGAKSQKEAKQLLQKAIGFGSITVPKRFPWLPDNAPSLEYGGIVRMHVRRIQKPDCVEYEYTYNRNITHATDPVERKDKSI